ncbi:MAG: YHS domain-containing protein [Acidobacteria bacterium]|nr:YHS domain-containing protein [Acidobacteriota bacterium]MBP8273149.1 YHS domain-containing protein [Acidobacteriota bacterium]
MAQTATCPVCGMSVDVNKDTPRSEYEGQTYFFCCTECKETFDKQPENFTS